MFKKIQSNTVFKKIIKVLIVVFYGLYVFSLPSFSGRTNTHILPYFCIVVLLALVFCYTLFYLKFRFQKRLLLLPLFVSFTIIGTIVYSHQFRTWITMFLLSATFFIFYYAFICFDDFSIFIKVTVLSLFVFCLYFIFHYRHDIFNSNLNLLLSLRLGDYFDNVNQIGSYMTIGMIFSLFLIIFLKKKLDLIFIAPTIIFLIVGFLTGSRTFVVSVFIEAIALLAIKLRKRKLLLLFIIIILVSAFVLLINLPLFSFIKSQLLSSFYTLLSGDEVSVFTDRSTRLRILWQEYGFYLGSKNVFFGYGCGGFSIYSGVGTYTHGNFAEMICDFGFIGLLLFLVTIIFPVYCSIFERKNISLIVFPLFILFLLNKIMYTDKTMYLIIAFMYACIPNKCSMTFFKWHFLPLKPGLYKEITI